MDYLLAIDQGTTSTTALILEGCEIISSASCELRQNYPGPGMVEHAPEDIRSSVRRAVTEAMAQGDIKGSSIAGIGIANQRETFSLLDPKRGWTMPFIVWQCRRSEGICHRLKDDGFLPKIYKRTGLPLDPYFSATKLRWLMERDNSIHGKLRKGELLFGTVDTFLCHWLSGGELFITDVTNASRTMMMDIRDLGWSDEILDIFAIPKACLPPIKKNLGPYGVTKALGFLPDGIPIAAMAGDQQAALIGQGCFLAGDVKATLGTGSFLLQNVGELVLPDGGLISTVAYHIDDDPIYCLEGSAFVAGAAVQFLRDGLGMIKDAREVEQLAREVADSAGVIFVPALCGLGAPHWRPEARGTIFGLERGTKKGHIARATLEAIALQNADIITAMAERSVGITTLKVDGGAAKNDLLMQMQADLLGVRIARPHCEQMTALGAAYLAGLALKAFDSPKDITNRNQAFDIFEPNQDRAWADDLLKRYHEALNSMINRL